MKHITKGIHFTKPGEKNVRIMCEGKRLGATVAREGGPTKEDIANADCWAAAKDLLRFANDVLGKRQPGDDFDGFADEQPAWQPKVTLAMRKRGLAARDKALGK